MLANGKDSALLRYALGDEYLTLGDHDKAVVHLRKAVDFDPTYSAAWRQLGKALAAATRYAEAMAAYDAGIRAAEEKGDVQAAKEMRIFLRRLQKQTQ